MVQRYSNQFLRSVKLFIVEQCTAVIYHHLVSSQWLFAIPILNHTILKAGFGFKDIGVLKILFKKGSSLLSVHFCLSRTLFKLPHLQLLEIGLNQRLHRHLIDFSFCIIKSRLKTCEDRKSVV